MKKKIVICTQNVILKKKQIFLWQCWIKYHRNKIQFLVLLTLYDMKTEVTLHSLRLVFGNIQQLQYANSEIGTKRKYWALKKAKNILSTKFNCTHHTCTHITIIKYKFCTFTISTFLILNCNLIFMKNRSCLSMCAFLFKIRLT